MTQLYSNTQWNCSVMDWGKLVDLLDGRARYYALVSWGCFPTVPGSMWFMDGSHFHQFVDIKGWREDSGPEDCRFIVWTAVARQYW